MAELNIPISGAARVTGSAPHGAARHLHIVHVLTRLLRAGSEENTVATCRWQAAAGHRVTLIHGADFEPSWRAELAGQVTVLGVPEMVHPVQPHADWQAVAALKRVFRALDPDVIHTHQSKAGILGRFAASAVPGALVVHGIHILPFAGVGRLTRAAYIAAERIAARRTDVFVAVSDSVARAYVDARICARGRVHVVHSGMDLAPFRNARSPADAATLIGGPDRPPVILMLAAFEKRKRHIPFLAIMPRIIAAVPNVRLLLAGAGPEEAAVRSAVRALNLDDHVVFCGHRPDPAALIALADLTVLTSVREGLPRVVVQSIAAGCPVVVTRLPGIDEIVSDGGNGCVTDADNLAQTADRIVGLLTDPAALDRLRRGAAATDVSDWSLDRLGARTTALYAAGLAER